MIRTTLRISGGAIALSISTFFQALPARASVPHRYQVTDLGTLGGTSSLAYGINEAGDAVGVAEGADGINRAFVWSGGTMRALPDLGFGSVAYDTNNSGHVTGSVDTGLDYTRPWDGRSSSIDNVALWQSDQRQSDQLVNRNYSGLVLYERNRDGDQTTIVFECH